MRKPRNQPFRHVFWSWTVALMCRSLFAVPDGPCKTDIVDALQSIPSAIFRETESMVVPRVAFHHAVQIDPDKVKERKTLAIRSVDDHKEQGIYTGRGWLQLERASLNDKQVFVKTLKPSLTVVPKVVEFGDRTMTDVEEEIFWATFLAKTEWGVPFHGVVKTGDHPSLVFDWVPGFHFDNTEELPEDAVVTDQTIEKLRRFMQFAKEKNIFVRDFQIRLKPDGDLVIIDSEQFRFTTSEYQMESSIHAIDNVIAGLQRHMRKRKP